MRLQNIWLSKKKLSSRDWIENSTLFWILVFSFQFTFQAGQRGYFAFDQSIVFDGAYRIFSGQIPFKDFLIPFGPMVFWLQGMVFKLLGVNYAAYIFGAAAGNTLMTLGVYVLMRALFPRDRFPAYIGALLTAVWFYAPFGTPWPEQTAFFFNFIALGLTLGSILKTDLNLRKRATINTLAGLAAFAAFVSKQNAGAFFVPVIAIVLFVAHLRNLRRFLLDGALTAAGWLAGGAAFTIWLLLRSDINLFYKHFFVIPAEEVSLFRIPETIAEWLGYIFIGKEAAIILILTGLAVLLPVSTLVTKRNPHIQKNLASINNHLAATLILTLFFYQHFFLITSNNVAENSIPFTGLIAALGLGLLQQNFKFSIIARTVLTTSYLTLTLAVFGLGANVAFSRQVHSIFQQSTFPHRLQHEKLSALRWADPTRIHRLILASDIDNVLTYLEQSGEHFFIFPDFTLFYGLIDVPSPQPLLWFHNGLTFSRLNYDPALDAWVVADLQKNQVGVIILEQESWFHTDVMLGYFPQLETFIEANFIFDQQIGNFMIYVQKDN